MLSDTPHILAEEGDVRVILATPNDAQSVLALQDLLFPGDPNALPADRFGDVIAHEANTVLVARRNDAVLGFLVLRDRGLRPWTGVDFVGVAPEAQGKGVGALLVKAGCKAARRPVIRLFVHPDNHRAQSLYTRLGFRQTGTRKDNYADGADAIIMMKWLGPRSFRRDRDRKE